MDKQFEDWIKEFDKSYKGSESYQILVGRGYGENDQKMLGWFLQYKQQQSNEKMLLWTKVMAIAACVSALATALLIKYG